MVSIDSQSTKSNTPLPRSFHSRLEFSRLRPDEYDALHKSFLANFPVKPGQSSYTLRVGSLEEDRAGGDFVATATGMQPRYIETKVRSYDPIEKFGTHDYLLEVLSNERIGSVGWAADPSKLTHVLYFIFRQEDGGFRLSPPIDYRRLRAAVIANAEEWGIKYGWKYCGESKNVAVPCDVLEIAMAKVVLSSSVTAAPSYTYTSTGGRNA